MARLFVALQYLLPQHLLSRFIGALARSRWPLVRKPLLGFFLRAYQPDLRDAERPDPRSYSSFNDFFTRALKSTARPLAGAPRAIVSPVDGRISALGATTAGRVMQAKGHDYSLRALLAGDARLTGLVAGGPFMTIYLAPYNYHRIHMSLGARLVGAWFVPGRLFSVNDVTAQRVPGLFARNERLILEFSGEHGSHLQVWVGALFVGSMSTIWHGDIVRRELARQAKLRDRQSPVSAALALPLPPPGQASVAQGAELGRFNMGSTVILLWPEHAAHWKSVNAGQAVQVGQLIGQLDEFAAVSAQ